MPSSSPIVSPVLHGGDAKLARASSTAAWMRVRPAWTERLAIIVFPTDAAAMSLHVLSRWSYTPAVSGSSSDNVDNASNSDPNAEGAAVASAREPSPRRRLRPARATLGPASPAGIRERDNIVLVAMLRE